MASLANGSVGSVDVWMSGTSLYTIDLRDLDRRTGLRIMGSNG